MILMKYNREADASLFENVVFGEPFLQPMCCLGRWLVSLLHNLFLDSRLVSHIELLQRSRVLCYPFDINILQFLVKKKYRAKLIHSFL